MQFVGARTLEPPLSQRSRSYRRSRATLRANFSELRHGEVRRIYLLRTRVNNPFNQRMSNARKVPSEHQIRPPAQEEFPTRSYALVGDPEDGRPREGGIGARIDVTLCFEVAHRSEEGVGTSNDPHFCGHRCREDV